MKSRLIMAGLAGLLLAGTFWLSLGAAPKAAAQSQDALIHQAEEAFAVKRYPEAIQAYERLAEQAPADPAVLYNLGTAYAQSGQRGMAIWRYLQALEIAPRDRETWQNLQILAPKIAEQMAVTPIPPVDWLYQHFTGDEWAAMAGGTTALALLLLALYYWRGGRGLTRAPLRGLILSLLGLAVLTWPFAVLHFYHEDTTWRGVVVGEKTSARAGPSENQTETDKLPVGTILRIEDDSTSGWLKFSYAGGRMGFVERGQIRFL